MAKYLLQVSFTLDGIRGLHAQGGSVRKEVARQAIESAGGNLEAFYFAFGDTDVFVIAELPDHSAAAAVALSVTAAGGATVTTTVLVEPEEIDEATARNIAYRPPGA